MLSVFPSLLKQKLKGSAADTLRGLLLCKLDLFVFKLTDKQFMIQETACMLSVHVIFCFLKASQEILKKKPFIWLHFIIKDNGSEELWFTRPHTEENCMSFLHPDWLKIARDRYIFFLLSFVSCF